MYAAVILLKLENANYDDMNKVALNAPDNYKGAKGFVNAIYYSDKEKGEYGAIAVYETKEDLEAHMESLPAASKENINKSGTFNIYYVNNAFSA
jgi:hypothetical protein